MTSRKVQNPNAKSGAGFIWAIVAVVAIALVVIGLIVFNGQKDRQAAVAENMIDTEGISVSWNKDDNFIRLAAEGVDDAPMAELYEDFACGYCAKLAVATDEEMYQEIKAGNLEVELRPMVAQDGPGAAYVPGHATTGLAAELALAANNEPAAMLNLRDYLMQNQSDVYRKVDNDDLADLARDYGAGATAVQEIRDGVYYEDAKKMSDANAALQEERTGEAWTPRVMVDGEDVSGDRDAWVSTVAKS